MNNLTKKKLLKLKKSTLVDALLEISRYSELAESVIQRITSDPNKNFKRFKKKINHFLTLNNRSLYDSYNISRKLSLILNDMKKASLSTEQYIELMLNFYRIDNHLLNHCDDSSGFVSDVFRYQGTVMFAEIAKKCKDHERILDIIIELNLNDRFGVRFALIEKATNFLSEKSIKEGIRKLQKNLATENDKLKKDTYLLIIKSFTKQIGDAKLYEKTYKSLYGKKVSSMGLIDIANVYFESGDIEVALGLLEKVPEENNFSTIYKNQLLNLIYRKQGNTEKLAEVYFRNLKYDRCIENFENLIEIIGEDKREKIAKEEIEDIMKSKKLDESDAMFLLDIEKFDEAEEYILERAEQLNGKFYEMLIPLAKTFEKNGFFLVTYILYRSLLSSILDRAYYNAYYYGVKYLKKMDELSTLIDDWKEFEKHEIFKRKIMEKHKRKRKFWSMVDEYETRGAGNGKHMKRKE